MSNEEVTTSTARQPRRSPRQGVGGSPVGSTLSIVLAAVAVIAGFLILRDLTSDDSSAGGAGAVPTPTLEEAPTTTFDSGITTTVVIAPSTTLPFVTEGAIVVVANGNTVGGSAGRMTETLRGAGFQMGSPTNASGTVDESIVYYDSTNTLAEAVAQSVARALGGVPVVVAGTPPPTESGSLGDAGVIVVLGNNQADKTLEQLAEAGGLATPELGSAPAVAGTGVVAPDVPTATDVPTTGG